MRRVVAGAVAGTALEAYDLYLYGTAAALVFGPLFFPARDPSTSTLLSLSAFAVAFVARPIGALVFGRLGDRWGRTRTLSVTLIAMGVGTAAIGLLPVYSQIGIVAPALLTVLRFLQGFAYGGEFTGGVLLLAEHAPPRRRGFYASLNSAAPAIGFVLSSVVLLALQGWLGDAQFLAWGWRLPFVLSLVLLGIGIAVRRMVGETPVFTAAVSSPSTGIPRRAGRAFWRPVFLAAGSNLAHFVFFYLVATFSLSYGTEYLDLPQGDLLGALTLAFATNLVSVPAGAALSDRIGRRPVIAVGLVLMAAWIWPFFLLLDSGGFTALFIAYLGSMIAFALVYGPLASFTAEGFPTAIRYTGAALSYHLAGVVGAALGPAAAGWLILTTGSWWGVAGYVTLAAAVSFVSVLASKETRGADLAHA